MEARGEGRASAVLAADANRSKKKTADIVTLIEFLLEYDTAGDPITGLKWSRRTTEKIAMALDDFGISVSPNTVARLLHQMGYSLRVNHKKLSTDFSPDRYDQFLYCYRAANWLHVGQTAGRGRMDREHKAHGRAIKDIYVYPLVRDVRQQVCGDLAR